ncbi:radical SAM protein [Methanospirillum lacunae]|uniref:Radical SAM protein n=1 Tax=Methanospirillum lacunae TaxID=668570 RepID=A0A2V2NC45_9EURY|nr:radical SAM protein [Methanospirillum lacunae]PWR74028.1 radical SAM protein [Methanospirillum lacunae]
MTAEAWIIDGYVDEPACLGVPPYISPYIRTVAGVLISHGFSVRYCTIDQVRGDHTFLTRADRSDIVVMIAGVTVPGKYLGGTPAGYTDIRQIGSSLRNPTTYLGGPVLFGSSPGGGMKAMRQEEFGFDQLLQGSPATALDSILNGSNSVASHSYSVEDEWAIAGAGIVRDHPLFPYVLCELETSRGCSHAESGGCSFCTEPFYGKPVYRDITGIQAEVQALSDHGVRHFRLGRQPDLLTYQAGPGEFPVPRPEILEELFTGIRTAAPEIQTLHIDNINPGTIARHPDASREALSVIVKGHTPGDVAAFGMETADPAVVKANNLKADPDMVMEAVRIVNEVGVSRDNGVPHLLPGLNFICGLAGETSDTYRLNREFLERIMRENLLVRRVNIRQLMPFEGTRAWSEHALPVDERLFRQFKEDVRKRFDLPMLKMVYPVMTVLRDVIIEESGDTSFGRQLGSYPILVGIPLKIPVKAILNVVIVDHGMRSVTGLPWPVPINDLPAKVIKWIPGLPKSAQARILAKRPFNTLESLEKATGVRLQPDLFVFTSPAVPSL